MTNLYLNKLSPIDNAPDIITPHNIKQALQDRSHLTHHPNPLENLAIIDEIIANRLFLNGPHGRRFALWELLNDLITHQLSTYRSAMGICPQPRDSTRRRAFAAIRQDVQTGNRHLIAWSWLYYGYIRVDLNITQENYAQESHFDNRTIRRYQAAALSSIAEILIQREGIARKSKSMGKLDNATTIIPAGL